MNVEDMTNGEWAIHHYMVTKYEVNCHQCYDREWIPVSVETFMQCYGLRVDAGMMVNIREKVDECSIPVGRCTCSSIPPHQKPNLQSSQ